MKKKYNKYILYFKIRRFKKYSKIRNKLKNKTQR